MQRFVVISWLVVFVIFGAPFVWALYYLPESKSAAGALGFVLVCIAIRATFDVHPRLRAWNLNH